MSQQSIDVHARILHAVRPQLEALEALTKRHIRAATAERLRREHRMWDSHDDAVLAYDTGQQMTAGAKAVGKTVGDTWNTLMQFVEATWDGIRDAMRKAPYMTSGYHQTSTPAPVHAAHHASARRPDSPTHYYHGETRPDGTHDVWRMPIVDSVHTALTANMMGEAKGTYVGNFTTDQLTNGEHRT